MKRLDQRGNHGQRRVESFEAQVRLPWWCPRQRLGRQPMRRPEPGTQDDAPPELYRTDFDFGARRESLRYANVSGVRASVLIPQRKQPQEEGLPPVEGRSHDPAFRRSHRTPAKEATARQGLPKQRPEEAIDSRVVFRALSHSRMSTIRRQGWSAEEPQKVPSLFSEAGPMACRPGR
jgi:hypothetical protein